MPTLDDVLTGTEEQERASAVGALRLSLLQAFVTHKRGLLVARKASDLHALERSVGKLAIHLGRGDNLRENGVLNFEELEQNGVPLEFSEVHEQGTRSVCDIGDMQVGLSAAGQTLHK